MSFNNAFKYFYSCKDENNTFTWNNNIFRLELKSIEDNTNLVETNNESDENQILVAR